MDIVSLLIDTAREKFGIMALKPYQLLVTYRILDQDRQPQNAKGLEVEKRPQIVILPTGTGKSLCFLLPAVLCSGITVIVYPLLALMNDQIAKLKYRNIPCVTIRGGQTREQRSQIARRLASNEVSIVITNPETLEQERVLKMFQGIKISLFVCDEAHVTSAWGESFRPAYKKLGEIINTLAPEQTIAFTATAANTTLDYITKALHMKNPVIVRGDCDRENIHYSAFPSTSPMLGTMEILKRSQKPAVVFCRTRSDTQNSAVTCRRILKTTPVRYYHAGLSKPEREALEQWFMQSHDGILFCTTAYGMGVDKSDIRTVIHQKLPDSAEAYLQESGRAGRDGKVSEAWAIVTPADFEKQAAPNIPVAIFTSGSCRRIALLKAMDQDKEECSGCDVCCGQVITQPPELKTVLRMIRLYPLQFTVVSAAMVLCGTTMQFRTNPFYGILDGMDSVLLTEGIRSLVGNQLWKWKVKEDEFLYIPLKLQRRLSRALRPARRSSSL